MAQRKGMSDETDEELFRKIIDEHGEKVYNIALFTVQNERDADDVTQEVFIKVYRGLPRFRGESQLSTWLYRITKNACYNHLRREKRYRMIEPLESARRMVQTADGPEGETLRQSDAISLRSAVGKLPPKQRVALALFYFYGNSYDEIAKIMNVGINTVKSHIHRGRNALRLILTAEKGGVT